MRYLNKIVFINSATVPYAEVPLDGNIHFIGTQGVGKSTVLRAILYFYNADSRKLGIPQGRIAKTFAEFYLSYSNSYIVYEVAKETGAFCVVAYKSQNRVCYRFIDTAYKAEYFIKPSGDVFENWGAIREILDAKRINMSSVVNSYDKYRDILYGNFTGRSEFNKYALLEAKQYKNIYRTIQNVFLNTKLDANEIKQTIISSIEDERIYIDLDQYRKHLNGFEQNIEDIRKFRLPSVQKHAENAIHMLSAIRHLNSEQSTLVGHLLYRINLITVQEPVIRHERAELTSVLAEKKIALKYELQLYDKRKTTLNAEIGRLDGKLKDATKQKKYYQSKNIAEILIRVANQETVQSQLVSLQQQQHLLTSEFSNVNDKYEALIKEDENQLNVFTIQKGTQKNSLDEECIIQERKLNKEYDALAKDLEKEFEIELENETVLLQQSISAVQGKEKQKIAIKHTRLYEKEISLIDNAVKEAHFALNKASQDKETYSQQINNVRITWENEKYGVERSSEYAKEKLHVQLNDLKSQHSILTDRIARGDNTLYGWLNKNKPGWESSMGKIISKEALFNDGLSPQLTNDDDVSVYGVKLDLNDLVNPWKTMDDYRFELSQLDVKITELNKILQKEDKTLKLNLDKIKRRHSAKIKELKELMRQAEYQFNHQGQEVKKYELELVQLREKAQLEHQQQLKNIQQQIDQAIEVKQLAQQSYNTCKGRLRQKKEVKQREKTRRVNEILNAAKLKKEELELLLVQKQQVSDDYRQRLAVDRSAELDSKGADIKRLVEVEKAISRCESELDFITRHSIIVIEYKKDKRELFDKEKDFKNEIASLKTKIDQKYNEYSLVHDRLSKDIAHLEEQIEEKVTLIKEYELDMERYEAFPNASSYKVMEAYETSASPLENAKTAIKTIEEITEKFYSVKERMESLQTHIDHFLSQFSERNIFAFPYKLSGDQYMNWAQELSDFIDNNEIDEFEKRTSERFAYIISTVGNDTTDLISKTGEIKKIISKINADFKQKNFVTAVDNIEMDITESKNAAVLLLTKIMKFNDENALSIGVANLFSGNDQDANNMKAVGLLKQLIKVMDTIKNSEIQLTDSFELRFRVVENGNDTGWADKLTNVGSEGTDVLVKAMVNIMLLNVFKEGASRKFKDFKLHCMMDEIGKLHPTNVKGILKFANERNILLINGSPTESTPLNYRHIYKISKDVNKHSKIKRIISNPLH